MSYECCCYSYGSSYRWLWSSWSYYRLIHSEMYVWHILCRCQTQIRRPLRRRESRGSHYMACNKRSLQCIEWTTDNFHTIGRFRLLHSSRYTSVQCLYRFEEVVVDLKQPKYIAKQEKQDQRHILKMPASNRNPETYKAPLKSQTHGTSLLTSAAKF